LSRFRHRRAAKRKFITDVGSKLELVTWHPGTD
jgi:hypothetical protein